MTPLKKLTLNKETLVSLDTLESTQVRGGDLLPRSKAVGCYTYNCIVGHDDQPF